jgi:superfamily II DNA/RNA helicase
VRILLAPNVPARGLDVAEVGLVIEYDLPQSAECLTHRVGVPSASAGAGRAITVFTPEEGATILGIIAFIGIWNSFLWP